MIRVLFVCMGNICRSPMAEGAFRAAVIKAGLDDQFDIDSAGTIGYHAGSGPDPRAVATAQKHGVTISGQRARQVRDTDFAAFDYILAMDHENFSDLIERCPKEYQPRISLLLRHDAALGMDEMPDPYYGHRDQFDHCYGAAIVAADALLATILAERRTA